MQTESFSIIGQGDTIRFPRNCVCCGVQTADTYKHEYKWSSTNGSGAKLRMERRYADVSLCKGCKGHWNTYKIIRYIFIVGMELITAGILYLLWSRKEMLNINEPLLVFLMLTASLLVVVLFGLLPVLPKPKASHTARKSGLLRLHTTYAITTPAGGYSYLAQAQNTEAVFSNEQIAAAAARLNQTTATKSAHSRSSNKDFNRSILLSDDNPIGLLALSVFPFGLFYLIFHIAGRFSGNR